MALFAFTMVWVPNCFVKIYLLPTFSDVLCTLSCSVYCCGSRALFWAVFIVLRVVAAPG